MPRVIWRQGHWYSLFANVLTFILLSAVVNGQQPANQDKMSDAVPAIKPGKTWDRFRVMIWQHQTDAKRDQQLYQSLRVNAFHIDRQNQALRQFSDQTGWPFYVDHAADKGYLHLSKHADQVTRKKTLLVRPNSLADPSVLTILKQHLESNVRANKGSNVLAYALDDEVSLGSFCTPAEVDTHPASLVYYRRFLERMYGSVARLNEQYGTKFGSFADVQPVSFEDVRKQLQARRINKVNLSRWCDWRAAMDSLFADTISDLVRYTNQLDPSVPAGFVGGQAPNAWGGYDYRKLSQAVQWIEAYDIGQSNEILRSFWSQDRPRVQTFFSSKSASQDRWFLWYYLVHGNRGVIAWPEGWFADGKVAPHISQLADTFAEVQGDLSTRIINGTFLPDPVAIYYSHPSVQMSWALDASVHGGTWPNRSSSMDNALSTSNLSRVASVKLLEDIGIQPTFIHSDHLLTGELIRRKTKVLILNRTLCLSDDELSALKEFTRSGGQVIADHLVGLFDEHGRARTDAKVESMFSMKRDPSAGWFTGEELTEVDGERDHSSLSAKNWAGSRSATDLGLCVIERGLSPLNANAPLERGMNLSAKNGFTLMNVSPIGYLMTRTGKSKSLLRASMSQRLAKFGITPRVTFTFAEGQAPHVIPEILFWQSGNEITLCVVANPARSAKIDGMGELSGINDKSIDVTLTFQRPVDRLKNLRTGAELKEQLGDGTTFRDRWQTDEANVYTMTWRNKD